MLVLINCCEGHKENAPNLTERDAHTGDYNVKRLGFGDLISVVITID